MKKSLILLVILFLLSLLTSNLAKAASYSGQPIPHSIGRASNLPPMQISPYKDNNEKLYAVVGKTQLIKFDEPVKRISLTDPSLADLVLLSPKELLLNGKKSGRTSLLFWGSSEKPVFFNMVVQQDTDAVIQAIEQVAPNENVKYTFTDDGMIMSGKISSTAVKKNITEVVKAYGVNMLDLTESPTKQVLLELKSPRHRERLPIHWFRSLALGRILLLNQGFRLVLFMMAVILHLTVQMQTFVLITFV